MTFMNVFTFTRITKIISTALIACMHLHIEAKSLDTKKTEVIIVGTVHKESVEFKTSSLVAILERVKPDIVLVEYDSSFFTKNYKFIRNFGGLEQTAILTYSKCNRLKIRPYDIECRNDYYRANNVFKREESLLKDINRLDKDGRLDSESKNIIEQIRKCFVERNSFMAAPPEKINSFDCDKAMAQKAYVMDFGYSEIIHRMPELNEYSEFWKSYAAFESMRNKKMITNIYKYCKAFKGKRIVVLCGFEHRHQLRFGLRISTKTNITLTEYWDYSKLDQKPSSIG